MIHFKVTKFWPLILIAFTAGSLKFEAASANQLCSKVHSAFYLHNSSLLEAVANLHDGQEISPEIYSQFSVNEIAYAIAERFKRYESRALPSLLRKTNQKAVDLMSESEIMLFFHSENTASISERGFLNQHQSGKSKGMFSPTGRIETENWLTQLSLGVSEEALRLRPKSAFLNLPAIIGELGARTSRPDNQYGDIAAVFKQEVKRRSVWTYEDSLSLSSWPPKISTEQLIPSLGTFFNNRLNIAAPNSNVDSGHIYEALIYGEIGVKDVDYFLSKGTSNLLELSKLGKPIYLLKITNQLNRTIYEKGDLLYPGYGPLKLPSKFTVNPLGQLFPTDREANGSTGGKWYKDTNGTFWFVKKDVHYAELQTSAEVISSKIYQHFGYRTPENIKLIIEGVHYSASKDIGFDGKSTNFSDMHSSEIRQLRVVAAYLKDWDRLGNPGNNLVSPDGVLTLLDFGGSLGSRARGEYKARWIRSKATGAFEASRDFKEVYLDFNVDAPPEHPWNQLNLEDANAVVDKFRALTDEKIAQIVESAGYTQKSDANIMIDALVARRETIISHLTDFVKNGHIYNLYVHFKSKDFSARSVGGTFTFKPGSPVKIVIYDDTGAPFELIIESTLLREDSIQFQYKLERNGKLIKGIKTIQLPVRAGKEVTDLHLGCYDQ